MSNEFHQGVRLYRGRGTLRVQEPRRGKSRPDNIALLI